jgi:Tfp pilus assembly protein PilV
MNSRSQRRRFRLGDERGFSLAEVVTAAGIIMTGLVAVGSAYPYAMSGVETGKQQSTATFLAEQRLEELKATAVTDPALTSVEFWAGTLTETSIPGYPAYTRATTISGGATPTTRLVRVTVSYRPGVTVARENPARSVSLETVLATRQ